MGKITILGQELDLNLLEYRDAKRVEEAMNAFSQQVNQTGADQKSLSEQVLDYCTAARELFNHIFGAGTDKKLFGDRIDLGVCAQAFSQLAKEITQNQPQKAKEFFAKYLPARQKENH